MGSSKAPKTPDYSAVAEKQGQADKETAQYLTNANRVNQIDPYGQTTWSQETTPEATKAKADYDYWNSFVTGEGWTDDGRQRRPQDIAWAQAHQLADAKKAYDGAKDSGRWTQTTTLTPEQQALLVQQQGIQGQQNTRISDLLKTFQTPTMGSLKSTSQNDIQNLLYGQITKQYGDRFAKEEASQKAQLANMGFQMGSEGYQNTLNDFAMDKNSAYQDAATQAALSSYDQTNKERQLNQSEYGLEQNRYNTQMGYLTQLLGGVQGPTTPQYQPFAQASAYQSPDYMGAAQGNYQGDLNKANAQNASRSQTIGAVGTIAAAAAVAF